MNIENIQVGKSYECNFVKKQIPLDRHGRPGGMYSMADLPVERYGDYTSQGAIVARDLNTRLVEVQEHTTDKKFVVGFDDIWDLHEA